MHSLWKYKESPAYIKTLQLSSSFKMLHIYFLSPFTLINGIVNYDANTQLSLRWSNIHGSVTGTEGRKYAPQVWLQAMIPLAKRFFSFWNSLSFVSCDGFDVVFWSCWILNDILLAGKKKLLGYPDTSK